MMYMNRSEAGQRLAERLVHYRNQPEVIVLGLPRGGVAVANEIAKSLNCPLDVLLVRKIGFPGRPELAVGAVSESGALVINEDIVSAYAVSRGYLDTEIRRQKEEIARRCDLFREGKERPAVEGKTVIVVDDGVATGATLKAAVATLKKEKVARLVAAVPVASREAEKEISPTVDEWICLQTPPEFRAVGIYYRDFTQVEDEDVVAMLK